jgi:phospholipase C
VPSLVISPYARKNYIDHQTLSFDAYLKFIEDDFLGGQRLDPKTDGRPDGRPTVRENVKILGDLTRDFDFNQKPRPPLILPESPKTDLLSTAAMQQAVLGKGRTANPACLQAGSVLSKNGSTLTVTQASGLTGLVTTSKATTYTAGSGLKGSLSLVRPGSLLTVQGKTQYNPQNLNTKVLTTATSIRILDGICPPYANP